MQSLSDLDAMLEETLKQFPKKQRVLHEQLSKDLLTLVQAAIGWSINDSRGKIAGWQRKHVGSGGGYAAVRATDSSSGDNSPGAITNYLESGHKIRTPSGHAKRYRQRIKMIYVNGRHFYKSAKGKAAAFLQQRAQELADEIAREMNK